MVPTSPRATTLRRLVPLAVCSGRPRNSSAKRVTEDPLLARVLTKPPIRPAIAARMSSSPHDKTLPHVVGGFYPWPQADATQVQGARLLRLPVSDREVGRHCLGVYGKVGRLTAWSCTARHEQGGQDALP